MSTSEPADASGAWVRRMRATALTATADVVAVLVFVVIGRANHDDGLSPSGVLSTLWPFLVGTGVGWSIGYVVAHVNTRAIGRPRFHPETVFPHGLLIWIATVGIGMVLRQQFGQGIAVSFVIVATVVLGVFLLGWRQMRVVVARRKSGAPRDQTS